MSEKYGHQIACEKSKNFPGAAPLAPAAARYAHLTRGPLPTQLNDFSSMLLSELTVFEGKIIRVSDLEDQ